MTQGFDEGDNLPDLQVVQLPGSWHLRAFNAPIDHEEEGLRVRRMIEFRTDQVGAASPAALRSVAATAVTLKQPFTPPRPPRLLPLAVEELVLCAGFARAATRPQAGQATERTFSSNPSSRLPGFRRQCLEHSLVRRSCDYKRDSDCFPSQGSIAMFHLNSASQRSIATLRRNVPTECPIATGPLRTPAPLKRTSHHRRLYRRARRPCWIQTVHNPSVGRPVGCAVVAECVAPLLPNALLGRYRTP